MTQVRLDDRSNSGKILALTIELTGTGRTISEEITAAIAEAGLSTSLPDYRYFRMLDILNIKEEILDIVVEPASAHRIIFAREKNAPLGGTIGLISGFYDTAKLTSPTVLQGQNVDLVTSGSADLSV